LFNQKKIKSIFSLEATVATKGVNFSLKVVVDKLRATQQSAAAFEVSLSFEVKPSFKVSLSFEVKPSSEDRPSFEANSLVASLEATHTSLVVAFATNHIQVVVPSTTNHILEVILPSTAVPYINFNAFATTFMVVKQHIMLFEYDFVQPKESPTFQPLSASPLYFPSPS
jgi:hypothetical protein